MPRTDADEWANSRWMPPSPHREAILERIAAGRAHIEAQGHGRPPLLVHEDGGILELPKVRISDRDLIAVDAEEAPEGATKHVDVCGTIDEIEAWLKEDPAGAAKDPERLNELLEHVLGMCRRMERRRQAYQQFAARVAEVSAEMQEVVGPDCDALEEEAEKVKVSAAAEDHPQVEAHAEAIRDVANKLEATLRKYRDAATALAALYEDTRGARDWHKDVEQRLAALRSAND